MQEFVPPKVDRTDDSKFDVRVYTSGVDILAIASRHFSGQVMEMRSDVSGFKQCLPEDVCCLPCLDEAQCEELMKRYDVECCAADMKECCGDACKCIEKQATVPNPV